MFSENRLRLVDEFRVRQIVHGSADPNSPTIIQVEPVAEKCTLFDTLNVRPLRLSRLAPLVNAYTPAVHGHIVLSINSEQENHSAHNANR